jgi:hypothetical protein
MALQHRTYSTRTLSLLMLAAFGGLALWLFTPWHPGTQSSNGGADANAALPPSLRVDGAVQVESANNVVTRLVVPLAVRGDEGIALADNSGRMHAETSMSDTASAAVPATYSVSWLDGNGDQILDPGEQALVTVDLPSASSVHPGNSLRLVLRPAGGGTLVIEDVLRGE